MGLFITIAIIIVGLVIFDASNRWRQKRVRQAGAMPPPGEATDEDIERLIRARRIMSAIKVYREVHGVSMEVARREVQRLKRELLGDEA
jgi:hypothetical protein